MAIVELAFVKDYLGPEVIGTTTDAILEELIIEVEQNYLDIQNKPWKLDTDGVTIIYPNGSKTTASRMVGYLLTIKTDNGKVVASESNLSYSISYGGDGSGSGGYPKSVIGSIKIWVRGV